MKVLFHISCLVLIALSFADPIRYCNEGLGICTKFLECSNSTVFDDGSNHLNVRFNIELETDHCHYLEMCCDPEDVIKTSEIDIMLEGIEKNPYVPPPPPTAESHLGGGTDENKGKGVDGNSGSNIHGGLDGENVGSRGNGNGDTEGQGGEDRENKCQGADSGSNFSCGLIGHVVTESGQTEIHSEKFVDATSPIIDQPHVTDSSYSTEPPHPENSCDEEHHECIPFFFCATDSTTDGSNLLASRSAPQQCHLDSQVCCHKSKNLARMKHNSCGVRNYEGVGYKLTNSHDEAHYGEFPWMAALSYQKDVGSEYLCGGSLIDPNVILTAAHCVNGKEVASLRVRLGEWDTMTLNEIFPHSDHEVAKVIVHPGFGTTNLYNDIALLVLKTPAKLSVVVNPVCLPPQNYKFQNHKCTASGWGVDDFGAVGLYRNNLKMIDLPLVSPKQCQDSLRATKLGPRFKLHTSFMCAGGERGIDTCTGDGGSPLVCNIEGTNIYFQAGIVAWGVECNQEGVPGVYVNVAKFRSWIDEQMDDLGYGTKSCTYVEEAAQNKI